MSLENFDDLVNEVLADRDARCAARENAMRRRLAAALNEARERLGLSVRDLAAKLNTSTSQVQRLLHEDLGGSISLATICRAADVLDLGVEIRIVHEPVCGDVVALSREPWSTADDTRAEAAKVEVSGGGAPVEGPWNIGPRAVAV